MLLIVFRYDGYVTRCRGSRRRALPDSRFTLIVDTYESRRRDPLLPDLIIFESRSLTALVFKYS